MVVLQTQSLLKCSYIIQWFKGEEFVYQNPLGNKTLDKLNNSFTIGKTSPLEGCTKYTVRVSVMNDKTLIGVDVKTASTQIDRISHANKFHSLEIQILYLQSENVI